MFRGKITKLTSGAAMLGVAPTLALQAQGGVDSASKETAMRFLEEGNNASSDLKKFGIGAVITILVTCIGWYAACVYFNKLALEKLKEGRSLSEKKLNLEQEIKELGAKILAYKTVKHDTKIDDKDPLKDLKSKIKDHKAKIEENNFQKVKDEFNEFNNGGRKRMESELLQAEKDWAIYNDKNKAFGMIKKIQDEFLEKFKDSADLLLDAQITKFKYETLQRECDQKGKFIKENGDKEKLKKTFADEKDRLVNFLTEVLNSEEESELSKSGLYSKFIYSLDTVDKQEIGEDMVDLKEAKKFIDSYGIDADKDSFKKLSKYREGISKQLEYKDKEKGYVRSERVFNKYSDQYFDNKCKITDVMFWKKSPLMLLKSNYGVEKQDIVVGILEKIEGCLKKMIDCQEKLKNASKYEEEFAELLKQKVRLEKANKDLQKKCDEKKASWQEIKLNMEKANICYQDVKEEMEDVQWKNTKKMFSDSGLRIYFKQFIAGPEFVKEMVSIKDVANKIDKLGKEVEKLKPEKTVQQLEQEIKVKGKTLRESLDRARNLNQEVELSEINLRKELDVLENSKKQKEKELEALGDKKNDVQYLDRLKEKEKELNKNIYKFNINPMKYYNEVNELIESGNKIQNA